MKASTGPVKARHTIETLQTGQSRIEAVIEVEQVLGEPVIDLATSSVTMPVEARMVKFDVVHDCSGPAIAADGHEVDVDPAKALQ